MGESSRLYIINEKSGAATAMGESNFTPALQGENGSLDFNPTVDRIRVVTASGQNLRLHPELGNVVATDGNISAGDMPKIGAVAYTNSEAGATTTQLYDIDFNKNKLFIQTPPNDGGLVEVGSTDIEFDCNNGFDIGGNSNIAYALLKTNSKTAVYTINLKTGAATKGKEFNINPTAMAVGLGF